MSRNDNIGRKIDNYELIELIGEGGMGEVYLAEQTHPIRRRVAIKIIKLGMDTNEFTDRFESERQALALMDHPYIAKVFDAGATERGRPYFVMEYVHGVPIGKYCNELKMSLRDRLELFIQVCEGIQHAHQKAIIHRDIKPSNVLVTRENDHVWPKIIDFGVAKTLDQKLTEHTIQTAMGQIMGTPEYMSPEQADMAESRIDTRTDIYLLGVLLYILLAGVPPFDPEQMKAQGLHAMLYQIRSIDPPRPSQRLAQLETGAEKIADDRSTTVPKLIGAISSDLDWITMRALAKEQDERYQTSDALIQDIRRHLNDEPVLAGPPSTNYRVRKFVKRNRIKVAAGAMVLAALVLGVAGTTVGLVKSKRSEALARTEAETSRQVSEFMVGLFEVSDPGEALGNTITAREILDQGVRKIETGLADQPETQARLMNTMGHVYRELGLFGDARSLLENSLEAMEDLGKADGPEAANVLDNLGGVLRQEGYFEEALPVLRKALEIRQRDLKPDDPDVAQSLHSLGNLFWEMHRNDVAEQHYLRALAIREKVLDPLDTDLAATLNNLGALRLEAEDFAVARPYFERALAIREASLEENHPDLAFTLANLGVLEWRTGHYERAGNLYERCLRIREEVLGHDHPEVGLTLNNYGLVLEALGEYEAARRAYERALAIYEAKLDPDHHNVADTLNNLAGLKRLMGDPSGLADAERAVAIRERVYGPDSPAVAEALTTAGVAMMAQNDFAGARARFERAIAIATAAGAGESLQLANNHLNLGLALQGLEDYEGARREMEKGLKMSEAAGGPDHLQVAEGCYDLGTLLMNFGEFAESRAHLDRALAIREAALGPDDVATAGSVAAIGLLLYYEGKLPEAREYYTRAVAVQSEKLPPGSPELVETCYNLGCLCARTGAAEEALRHLRRAVDNGFANPYIAEDTDLASLHGNPEFEAMVKTVLARAAQAAE